MKNNFSLHHIILLSHTRGLMTCLCRERILPFSNFYFFKIEIFIPISFKRIWKSLYLEKFIYLFIFLQKKCIVISNNQTRKRTKNQTKFHFHNRIILPNKCTLVQVNFLHREFFLMRSCSIINGPLNIYRIVHKNFPDSLSILMVVG